MSPRRKIRRSIRDAIAALIQAPPADMGMPAINVYGEQEMADGTHVPTWPYIYLIDTKVARADLRTPCVILGITSSGAAFELGNPLRVQSFGLSLAIIGTNRGQSEDLADLIQRHLLVVPVKDYDVSGTPTLVIGTIGDGVSIDPVTVSDQQILNGTLLYLVDLQMSLLVPPF